MGKHLRHLLQFSRVYPSWVSAGHLGSCIMLALHAGEVELAVIALVTAAWAGVVIVLVATASGTTATRSPLLVILIVRLLVVLEPAFIIVRV